MESGRIVVVLSSGLIPTTTSVPPNGVSVPSVVIKATETLGLSLRSVRT